MAKRERAKFVCELLINTNTVWKTLVKKKREWVKNEIHSVPPIICAGDYRWWITVATETFFRMNPNLHLYLFNKAKAAIRKNDTDTSLAIPAESKLDVTLRFLAVGDSFVSLR